MDATSFTPSTKRTASRRVTASYSSRRPSIRMWTAFMAASSNRTRRGAARGCRAGVVLVLLRLTTRSRGLRFGVEQGAGELRRAVAGRGLGRTPTRDADADASFSAGGAFAGGLLRSRDRDLHRRARRRRPVARGRAAAAATGCDAVAMTIDAGSGRGCRSEVRRRRRSRRRRSTARSRRRRRRRRRAAAVAAALSPRAFAIDHAPSSAAHGPACFRRWPPSQVMLDTTDDARGVWRFCRGSGCDSLNWPEESPLGHRCESR